MAQSYKIHDATTCVRAQVACVCVYVECPATEGYEHLTCSVSPHVRLFPGDFSYVFQQGPPGERNGAGANEDTHPDP